MNRPNNLNFLDIDSTAQQTGLRNSKSDSMLQKLRNEKYIPGEQQ